MNDFHLCSSLLEIYLFVDDTNWYLKNKKLSDLESKVNHELIKVNNWLCANKMSLSIDKTSFIFHPHQKRLTFNIELKINKKVIRHDSCIKYLGGKCISMNLAKKSQKVYTHIFILSK